MTYEIELVGEGQHWSFSKREVALGRDAGCDVRLTADEYLMVSRRHAILRATSETELWLEDQSSFNGTLLNGRRITRELVTSGDVIRLGEDGPELRVTLAGARANALTASTSALGSITPTGASPAPPTQHGAPVRTPPPTQYSAPRPATGGFATTSRTPTPSVSTRVPGATGGMQAPLSPSVQLPQPEFEELTPGEEAMLERKLAMMRNLIVFVIVLCIALGGVVVYQGQEIKKTRDTLNAMQRQAENAVGQFMPQLNSRLNRFDVRLDEFQTKMDQMDAKMDANMKRAEDRMVTRMDTEMPKIMDRYIQMKANELQRGGHAQVQVR
jgi:FHA domain-containing protein